MIYYISSLTKRLVTRNSGTPSRLLKIFNHTTDTLELSLVDPNNTLLDIPSGSYYLVGSFIDRKRVTTIFFSPDFTIEGKVLKFNYSTNTYQFLDLIKGENVQIGIEIGYKAEDGEHVILQDIAIASQRYYIDGMPTPQDVSQYYTKLQTEEAIDKATSGLASIEYVDDAISEATSGAVTKTYVDEQDALLQGDINALDESKQNLITDTAKLGYDLLSGTPTIPEKTSDLLNDSGFVASGYVDAQVSGKADKSELDNFQTKITDASKLGYDLLSGTPSIPTKTSDLQNDSDYATSSYVLQETSGKADKSELEDYQPLITAEEKLDYALLSGTPTIPTKTSDLQNDSDYATSSYVLQETSGKADKTELENYQKLITNDSKLGYDLLSGTPTIPLSTSQLANDSGYTTSGYVQQETSGKITNPSGGTAGQVLTKTSNGEEWADSQGGSGDGKDVTIESKDKTGTTYVVDFVNGKQIQKYGVNYAASGDIEISIASMEGLTDGTAPTVELQIPVMNEVSSIVIPSAVQIIEMPDVLSGGSVSGDVTIYKYHDIVFRAEKDCNNLWKTYANYAYAFNEVLTGHIPAPMPTSGMVFYMPMTSMNDFEAVDPDITVQDYNSSYPVEFTTQNGIDCAYCYGTPNRSIKIDNVTNSFPFGGTPKTVSFWVKYANSDYTAERTFFAEGQDRAGSSTGAGKAYDIICSSEDNGIVVMTMSNSANVVTSGSLAASLIQDQNWHHLCFTSYNNQSDILQVEMYIDGVLAYQANGTASMNTATYYSFSAIGGYSHLTGYWDKTMNGYIAGFRFYNRVLTTEEITLLASEFTPQA